MKPFSQGANVLCWGVSKCWLLWVAKGMSGDKYVYLPCGTFISIFTSEKVREAKDVASWLHAELAA